jgi:transposase
MDMWKPFRNSLHRNAPNARVVFDKFHLMRHLSDTPSTRYGAASSVDSRARTARTSRASATRGSPITGQRDTLLSHRENRSHDGKASLEKLLKANRRIHTAYLLKESFGQRWDYRTERGARAFFERWRDGLKWQRLIPYVKFA